MDFTLKSKVDEIMNKYRSDSSPEKMLSSHYKALARVETMLEKGQVMEEVAQDFEAVAIILRQECLYLEQYIEMEG
jgi:hypothetical protein